MYQNKLQYDTIIGIVTSVCISFFETEKRKFSSEVITRDDQKNVIYSLIRQMLSNHRYDDDELFLAVNKIVDEFAIKKHISSFPPRSNKSP